MTARFGSTNRMRHAIVNSMHTASEMPTHTLETARAMSGAVVAALGDSLRSVLVFGSAKRGAGHDIDMVIVLRGSVADAARQFGLIREAREQFPEHRFDIHPIFECELGDPDAFSLNGQGNYLLPILADAAVLHGDNPFVGMRTTSIALAQDVARKAGEYRMRLRMAACGGSKSRGDTNPDAWRKNVKKMMVDAVIAAGIVSDENAHAESFSALAPDALDAEDVAALAALQPLDVASAVRLTERVSDAVLRLTARLLADRRPSFHNIDGIACEVLLSERPAASWVVICDGIPSVPSRPSLLRNLAAAGFHVAFPRYLGTWESAGVFLQHSPSEDVRRVCDAIASGALGPVADVALVASSFGGSVALCAASHPSVRRVVAFSPIINYPEIVDEMRSLGAYLTTERPGAYRFDAAGWDALSSGRLLAPEAAEIPTVVAMTVLGGNTDVQATETSLRRFAESRPVELTILDGVGHIGFSKVVGTVWNHLLDALRHV